MNESGPTPEPRHIPVLLNEVLAYMAPQPGQTIVDATVGAGGHARALAERLGSAGRLVGLDQDTVMLDTAQSRLQELPVTLVAARFDSLRVVLDDLGLGAVDAVLADLGICSDQLDDPARGFSFASDGPLDMRLDQSLTESARDLIARLPERELADILWRFGEERHSRRIARRIVELRKRSPIETTAHLAQIVRACLRRPRTGRLRIDPATRTFQALRIAVNDELGTLERFLEILPACLNPGGRAVIISFHSLEDRQVKHAFRDRSRWQVLTPKPVQAGEEELMANPRARSAKLRAACKVA